MARPKFLGRNNDNNNAPVAKKPAANDNVIPKHVSTAHKADALQDLINDSDTPRPHVSYLQALGILPSSFSAKPEGSSSPSWAGATTSSSSVNFTPQANNPAISFLSFLGVSPKVIEAVQAQNVAIIAEQVAAQAQAAVENAITNNFKGEVRFYFVHSYFVKVKNPINSMMSTSYGITFDSAIVRDNIFGAQFHPEKSHKFGMNLFKNFRKNKM